MNDAQQQPPIAGFSALLLDDAEGGAAEPPTAESEAAGSLFKGLVFFLGYAYHNVNHCTCVHTSGQCTPHRREVPREQLLFVIRSFGGTVGWEGEGSPVDFDSTTITHQVRVCRPCFDGVMILVLPSY